MGVRDSRHTVNLPRWGINSGETLDPNAVEPPGPQKDTGWQPGIDVPVGDWWNWLHQQAYLFLAYLEIVLSRLFTINHLGRHQKGTTAFQVTAGAGLSVNVVGGVAWLGGAQYQFASVTNLALAAADPTDDRYDIIALEIVAGVPTIVVVTGTPDPSPSEPSLSAGQHQIARLRVNAAAVAPSAFVARRTFGAQALDRIVADVRMAAGDMGGGNYLLDIDTELSPVARLGEGGTTILGTNLITIFDGATQIHVVPEAVQFTAAIRRKFDIPRAAFVDRTNVDRQTIGGQEAFVDVGVGSGVIAPVHIPNGGVITAVRLYGYRGTVTPGFVGALVGYAKGTGVGVTVGSLPSNAGAGPTGNFTQEVTGLSHTVDQSRCYELGILWVDASGDLGLRAAEVEWEESKPFDGI